MKTSYFFSKRIREPAMNLVGVSNSYPKSLPWLQRIQIYKPLTPRWSLVHSYKEGKISQDQYIEIYQSEVLDRLDPEKVLDDLKEDAILLCWEKPKEFCHRRLIADWFYDHLKIAVSEL